MFELVKSDSVYLQLANYLRQRGVKKGDRVCIYMPMVPELPIAMLACARIGAIHSVCPSLCISWSPLDSDFYGVILQMRF